MAQNIAGIDVHKKLLVVVIADPAEPDVVLQSRRFGTGARFTEFSEARNPKAIQRAINHHLKALRKLGYSIPLASQPHVAPAT